jgi:hypothetical protein
MQLPHMPVLGRCFFNSSLEPAAVSGGREDVALPSHDRMLSRAHDHTT